MDDEEGVNKSDGEEEENPDILDEAQDGDTKLGYIPPTPSY